MVYCQHVPTMVQAIDLRTFDMFGMAVESLARTLKRYLMLFERVADFSFCFLGTRQTRRSDTHLYRIQLTSADLDQHVAPKFKQGY